MPGNTASSPASTSPRTSGEPTRLNVNINSRTADDLRRIAKRDGISYTEAVRRAVEVLAFITDEREAGNSLQVVNPGRNVVREIITL